MENSAPQNPAPSVDPADLDDHDPLDDRRPPSAPFYDWPDARADYLAGESAGVVAARLGVSYRTLQRRAQREGWRKVDKRRVSMMVGDPAHELAEIDRDSPLGLFVAATEYEVGELLFDPSPMRYIRFAFRRSAESAVRGRPTEALAWARLVSVLDKVAPGVSDTTRAFNSADYLRASFAEQLRGSMEPEEEEAPE